MRGPTSGDRLAQAAWWHRPLRVLIGVTVTELVRTRFRVELHGGEHLRHSRGALIVSNHRHDSDGPILAGVLVQRKGLRLRGVEPYFVAREDLFQKGFLGEYLETWPAALREPLNRLSVGPVLRALRLRPIRRVPEHSLGELLSDWLLVFGDLPLAEVLSAKWVTRFADATGRPPGRITVAQALESPRALLGRRNAFRRMTLPALRRLKPFEQATIASQLQVFVELLDAGSAVLLAPEGTVSPDGRFHEPRRALHHLLNAPKRIPRVLPVALSYDPMRAGRPRVMVRFGGPRDDIGGLSRRDTASTTKRAVLDQWMVNVSHLAAHYFLKVADQRAERPELEDLERFVGEAARRCQRLAVPIDPALLDPHTRVKRTAECLAFYRHSARSATDGLLEFLANELETIAEAHPGLLPRECP